MKKTKIALLSLLTLLSCLFVACNNQEKSKSIETTSSEITSEQSLFIDESTNSSPIENIESSSTSETAEESENEVHIHQFGDWTTAKEATCTEKGEKERVCECGEKERKETDALGHKDGEWITDTNATCVKEGSKHLACATCSKPLKTEAIPATGKHTYTSKVTTAATCVKEGVKTFTCSGCKDSYTETIKATGKHSYTSKVTTAATCTKDGIKTFTCKTCDNSYTEAIKAGHKWTNATCTEPKTCSTCKATEGKALGHTMDKGKCSKCSQTPTQILGEYIVKNGSQTSNGQYLLKNEILFNGKVSNIVSIYWNPTEQSIIFMSEDENTSTGLYLNSNSNKHKVANIYESSTDIYTSTGYIYADSFWAGNSTIYSYINDAPPYLEDDVKELAETCVRGLVTDIYILLKDEFNLGIKLSDFGFAKYAW